jgi:lipopolysaccharide transport system permease protein
VNLSKPFILILPQSLLISFWRNRHLVWQLTKRDVIGRYRGSLMGLLWSFFNPILMLAIYTFVFSVVFRARWGGGITGQQDFAIILFVGLIVHAMFAECINRSPSIILNNVNYVKRVVFPLEILPWMALGSALFHATISVGVLLVFYGLVNLHIHWTVIFLPVVLIPLALVTIGISWFLASVGVFVRDVGQATGIVTTVMLFLAPVFYPVSALPETYRHLLHLNPLTFIIEQARNVIVWGQMPNWFGLGVYLSIGIGVAWIGFAWFQLTRRGFADVM